MRKVIDFKNLNIEFKAQSRKANNMKIIRGIDVDIFEGQVVGFVGESGSGKSVVSKTFLGLNSDSIITADHATVMDTNVINKKSKKKKLHDTHSFWRKIRGNKVAYIPQDPLNALDPTKKIGHQIVEAYLENSKLSKKQAYKKSIETLESFGIENAKKLINSYPHEFSGGMQQRVVIAIAVACNAKIIIADEPTTALDPTIQSNVLALLQKINRELKITIIIISHDIAVIAKMASFIYVFYAGLIVEKGTIKSILTEPQHPYTWALLSAIPSGIEGEVLREIPGSPPEFANYPIGDPFASRNEYAQEIDFHRRPPLIQFKDEHYAATWLLHPLAKKPNLDQKLKEKLDFIKNDYLNQKDQSNKIKQEPEQVSK